MWNYRAALRSARLKPEELARLQDRKLRCLIRYAYDSVPFYYEHLRSAGIFPQDFRGTADLKLLPIITKGDVFANFPDKITSRKAKTPSYVFTSGTSGNPMKILRDAYYIDIRDAVRLRRLHQTGRGLLDRFVRISYVGSLSEASNEEGRGRRERTTTTTTNKTTHDLKMTLQFIFGTYNGKRVALRQKMLGLGNDNLSEVAMTLVKLKPDIIESRGSYLRRLGNQLEEQGHKLNVKRILVNGEALSPGCRQDLQKVYGAEVFHSYGAQEFGGLAAECRAHSGLHLNSDYYIFEFLRDNGEIILPTEENWRKGEKVEMLITCLHNRAMPLIRYRIGDLIQLGEVGECACGLFLPRLSKTYGRVNDGLLNDAGIRIAPGEIVAYLESVMGLRDFQLIQNEDRTLSVKLQEKDLTNERVVRPLLEYLHELVGGEIKIALKIWDDVTIPQKFSPVISKARLATADRIRTS